MSIDWSKDKTWKWVYEPTRGGTGNTVFANGSPNTGCDNESSGDEDGAGLIKGKPKPMGCMISLGDDLGENI